jgi:hypothetical protein
LEIRIILKGISEFIHDVLSVSGRVWRAQAPERAGGQTCAFWIVGRKSKLGKKKYNISKYQCQYFRLFLKIISGLLYGGRKK